MNRWAALAVVAAILVPVVVLAIRSDGFHATKVNLNDAGVWVVNWNLGAAGRINTQTAMIEVAVPAPTRSFDIAQVDDVVLLNVPEERTMVPVDVALARLGEPVEVPDRGAAVLGGAVGAVSDPASGKVWATPRAQLASLDTTTTPPRLEAGSEAVTVVGVDGTTYAYAPGSPEIHVAAADGTSSVVPVPPVDGEPAITVVGDRVVVLDRAGSRLVIPDREPVDLGGAGADPVLQLPGPGRDEVLIGTDDALLTVSLTSGEVREVEGGGSGGAVAPVWLGSCAYGAWETTPRYVQACEGRDVQASDIAKAKAGGPLQFRVNRNRVVLNDTNTGVNVLFTDDKPLEIDNWDDALNKDREDEVTEQEVVERPPVGCDEDTTASELVDDRAGTRPGRPVIVGVLDNDRFPRCEVPVVAVPTPPAADVARVEVVRDGTALQITPAPDRVAPVSFAYEVTTFDGAKRASVTVDIATAENSPPIAEPDDTSVVAGRSVRHDVLANDRDPEGDALTLVNATTEGGSVSFRADGEVAYTASGDASGTRIVTYTIEDERGEQAQSELRVAVSPAGVNVAPTAANDRVSSVAGREASVALLANDSDPNGDPLQIASVSKPADLDVTWDDKGELRVRPDRAGTWVFAYAITDGEKTADAQIRVDAAAADDNRPPVAVRDDLAVRPGIPGYLDLVANDLDPDGDLLAVVGIEVDPASQVTVELLDKHIVRVTAPPGFGEAVAVGYTVSDGALTSRGVLLVRPFDATGPDQAPIVGADEVTVRAGSISGIGVLENDLDPEGERLTLTRVGVLAEGEGTIFVEGDQLRYAAPPTGPATVRVSYTVEDPGQNRADGTVTIRVVPADHPNQPPRGPRLEARVFSGEETVVPVPVIGLDPDGDQVFVVAVSEPPTKGHAVPVAAGFSYRADRGATGTDSFSFVVRDALGAEATGVVRVAIVDRPVVNANPVAVPDRKSTKAGVPVSIPVLANDNDPDGDRLTLLVDGKDAPSPPRIGTVSVDGEGGLRYDPPADAKPGEVSFSYGVTDGRGGSARGIVTVTIEAGDVANRPPIARDDAAPLQSPGATVEVDVLANDLDPDGEGAPLQVAIVTEGVDASVTDTGSVRVTVADRSVALVYEITDAGGATARAVVSVPVLDRRPPVCETRTVEVRAGDAVAVDALDACRDPGGADLELVRVLAERGGTVRLDGSQVLFTADAEVVGDAGFAFLVSNGSTTGYGGVIVRVTGQDFPPAFARTSVDLPAGGTRSIDLAALVTDLNIEDRHTFTDLQGTTDKVQATITDRTLQVRAGDDAKGATTSLTLKVSDGTNTVDGQVDVRVLAHDGQPPAAVDDVAETFQNKPLDLDVTANDVDPIGQGLTVSVLGATGGTATVEGEKLVRFTPTTDFAGEATITYQVNDATKDPDRRATATARIGVIGFPLPPAAPSGLEESRQIRLTWGAAQPNGAPITEYVVESDQGERKTSPSNAMVFDGLTNGTEYRFRVAARNRAVERDDQLRWSEWSPRLTPDTRPGTPDAPTLRFGDRSIRVSWTPPTNEGTPITGYQVRISGNGAQETRDVGTVTQTDWGGLVNGQSYTFTVRARNDADWGEWSALSNDPVNSVPATVPGAPPEVAASRLDRDTTVGGWVRVTWGTPAPNGDANFTFVVSVSPADVAPVTIPNASARSAEIGGLRNGVAYTFTVVASNKAGTGTPASSSPATPAARPAPITSIRAVPGDGQARVTVQAGANNGAPIDSFQISKNGQDWAGFAVNANGVGTVDAANGRAHTFRVRACNEVGCSDPGPTSNEVIPFGPPRITSSASGSVITFRWDDQPGVESYSVSGANGTRVDRTTYRVDLGPGPARDATITVTAAGQDATQSASHTDRSEATTTIAIEFGASAQGEITSDGEVCSSVCRWIDIHMRGFRPNQVVVVDCISSRNGGEVYSRQTYQVDGNGNLDRAYPGHRTCFWGRNPGTTTWVVGDGVRSNSLAS